ncbi:MAG: lipoyl synthase [Anaerohalosphaeraceae bacterium]|nr:lipoyl synthase [Anaerohalosphaeraceae bacterium]
MTDKKIRRLPKWLKRPLPSNETYNKTANTLRDLEIETICTNAGCPNRGECWSCGTATVLILGSICTRNCKFCSVTSGKPAPVDSTEPDRVAQMAEKMKLKYLVITSVNRDDLVDGGASQFRDVVNKTRQNAGAIRFELLVPDFKGCPDRALEILDSAKPFVFGHNVETVPTLYHKARSGGDYALSLELLQKAKKRWSEMPTKSSIMLGLGETDEQVEAVIKDLKSVGCDRLAIGQYLKPSPDSLDVVEYITPEKFDFWAQRAGQLGFEWVMSSPFTRSSYHAEK